MFSDQNILQFRGVTVRYGRLTALQDVSFEIPCGESTAILGANGAGKSTLLRAVLGWQPLAAGEIGNQLEQHVGRGRQRDAIGKRLA